MHDYLASEILKELHEQTVLLRSIQRILKHANPRNVTSGELSKGDPMAPIIPGSLHIFTVTPEPTDATFIPTDSVITSSDTVNAPVTVDETGLIGTVSIAADAPVGTEFTLTWTYTNADGTTATASITETIVAAVVDVTGGTIEQTS